ncbi:HD-GYP domain-containing protein [Neptunomonas antarctica]|uniref:HDIG domain-containing protein n=1 Tax=Neptunomonas antarctica TaxID=619304 RepID=A0A1N7IU99_9GAMM|nr:HD-GYP domain-containing protein [Neptunomonas antarctica]SIS40610.1 HDIG domain-containing protein [Neptunomonas antarctica]
MPDQSMKMSELISALSHALDMTEGQPPGHCIRACWIGMQLGQTCGLQAHQLWELYYTILLKDLGCSSNAARICQLYATDDLGFKHDFKSVDGSLKQVLNFVLQHTGVQKGLAERFKQTLSVMRNGTKWSTELMQTRCERGADIARQLRFNEAVAEGIRGLDEHWNGGGKPYGLKGDAISMYSRIALLSQVIDVFFTGTDRHACLAEVEKRCGSWFEPSLVECFLSIADDTFWDTLASTNLAELIIQLEPAQFQVTLDEDYIDEIAAAFGQVVDSKSPFTAGHSNRVALITDLLARELGYSQERRRWLKRAALLHDVGKLGISNSILDKPDKLTDEEFTTIKLHPTFTGEILSRIGAFKELADVAQAHHERMDGKGYPLGLQGDEVTLDTRIITTADIFDAITADRPYRGPIPVPQALEMMAEHLDTQVDRRCYEALLKVSHEFHFIEH